MDEYVERLLQRSSVSAAHGQEAEAHPHVEPLADPAAPGQTRCLLLALRTASCTGERGTVMVVRGPEQSAAQKRASRMTSVRKAVVTADVSFSLSIHLQIIYPINQLMV